MSKKMTCYTRADTSKELFMKGDYCRIESKYYAEEYEDYQ